MRQEKLKLAIRTPALALSLRGLLGTGALLYCFWEHRRHRAQSTARREQAKTLYGEYLRLAIRYPHYASPDSRSPQEKRDSHEEEQYQWFVSFLLFAAESILEAEPGDPFWRLTLQDQLSLHQEYLTNEGFRAGHYSPALQDLIQVATLLPETAQG